MTTTQYQQSLHGIAESARQVMQIFGSNLATRPQNQNTPPLPHVLPHLSIPSPQPVTSRFVALGLNHSLAEELNQLYLDKASSLKVVYEDKHRQVVQSWLTGAPSRLDDMERFITATIAAYVSRYNQSLALWQLKLDEISQRHVPSVRVGMSRAEDTARFQDTAERRPAFKNDSVPILEQAFVVNAYPSRADKESLAEETGMEYKQVNIWFQNRRARSKREGMSLQRTATFATQLHVQRSLTAPLSSKSHSPSELAEERCTHHLEVCRIDHPKRKTDIFVLNLRPAHVFPIPYPPLYSEDPFPARSGTGSFPTPWLRRCAANVVRRTPADIQQVTDQMASLSLSSSDSNGYRTPLPSFTLVLPRAPLPALIRAATAFSRAQPVATLVSAPGSPSNLREFRTLYRALPPRYPRQRVERSTSPKSTFSITHTRPLSIPYSRSSSSVRSRRSETRYPSPPNSSRSSSSSSIASSRTTSSSWSIASSAGPVTPLSKSPRLGTFVSSKEVSPAPPSYQVHRSSGTLDDEHKFSSVLLSNA